MAPIAAGAAAGGLLLMLLLVGLYVVRRRSSATRALRVTQAPAAAENTVPLSLNPLYGGAGGGSVYTVGPYESSFLTSEPLGHGLYGSHYTAPRAYENSPAVEGPYIMIGPDSNQPMLVRMEGSESGNGAGKGPAYEELPGAAYAAPSDAFNPYHMDQQSSTDPSAHPDSSASFVVYDTLSLVRPQAPYELASPYAQAQWAIPTDTSHSNG
jgi:hypothetical protein